jgi:hypothetical protein
MNSWPRPSQAARRLAQTNLKSLTALPTEVRAAKLLPAAISRLALSTTTVSRPRASSSPQGPPHQLHRGPCRFALTPSLSPRLAVLRLHPSRRSLARVPARLLNRSARLLPLKTPRPAFRLASGVLRPGTGSAIANSATATRASPSGVEPVPENSSEVRRFQTVNFG